MNPLRSRPGITGPAACSAGLAAVAVLVLLTCVLAMGEQGVLTAAFRAQGRDTTVSPPPPDLRSVRASARKIPDSPLQRRNLAAALRRLDGTIIPPGATVDLGAVAGPWTGHEYALAPAVRVDPYLAVLGGGAEMAGALCLAVARAAGLEAPSVDRPSLPQPGPIPLGTLISNPARQAARFHAGWEAGRPTVTISPVDSAPSPAATALPDAGKVRLVAAVGDIGCDPRTAPALRRGVSALKSSLPARLLHEADMVVGNLETPLTTGKTPTPLKAPSDLVRREQFVFRGDPEAGRSVLAALGMDLVSLANNHIFDYGPGGIAHTHQALQKAGVQAAGPGRDGATAVGAAFTLGGHPFRLLSFVGSETLPPTAEVKFNRPWVLDTRPEALAGACATLARAVGQTRERGETPVVSLHWGVERVSEPTAAQRELARAAAHAGAALVLGHHPHRLQPVDTLAGCVIAYSLGNFVFAPARPEQALSAVLVVAVHEGRVHGAGLVPVRISPGGIPALLESDDHTGASMILQDLGVE